MSRRSCLNYRGEGIKEGRLIFFQLQENGGSSLLMRGGDGKLMRSEFVPNLCEIKRIRTALKSTVKSNNSFHKMGGGS